jgi:hypothetical protein
MGASQSDGADPGTVINATADPTQTLQSFTLDDLAQFTLEQRYSDNASKDFHLFYVGRDDVHELLKYILSRRGRAYRSTSTCSASTTMS